MRRSGPGLVLGLSVFVVLVTAGCATTEDVTGGSSLSAGNLTAGSSGGGTEATDGTSAGSSTTKGSTSSGSSSSSSGSSSSTSGSTTEPTTGETTSGTSDASTTDDSSSGTTGLDCADGLGNLCGNPMDIGVVEEGGSAMTPMGTIITPGVADWYRVQFPAVGRPGGGTPTIQFMMNEDDAFVFDLTLNMPCMGTPVTCETGGEAGKATKLTEFSFADDDPMCCSGPQDSLTPWPANVYVRVYRIDGGQTCSAYQLVFTR